MNTTAYRHPRMARRTSKITHRITVAFTGIAMALSLSVTAAAPAAASPEQPGSTDAVAGPQIGSQAGSVSSFESGATDISAIKVLNAHVLANKPHRERDRKPPVSRGGGRGHQQSSQGNNLASAGVRALAAARSKTGAPYSYGAAGPNAFDCSGLTSWAYAQIGKHLPRTSDAQAAATIRISNPEPGDLVFFHNGGSVYHVGLWVAPGQVFHASQSGTPIGQGAIWTGSVFFGRVR